ncbi:hypothetical protein [Phenylobacterium sp.]|uniref:hypothetical protein n=1 Tax=Phenylobacterium sp. TaxID=1871053 RepID=UPI002CF39DE4|nr:hypothetical protein [Phenylobacterium sp.]HLZ74021.1 hypothetical protein [Phenylobacterium sp.]
MQFIDSDRPSATKMAAIYELRRYPEHRDFIVRFCTTQSANVSGVGAQILIDEMAQTRDAMMRTGR